MKNYRYLIVIVVLSVILFSEGRKNKELTLETKSLILKAKQNEANAKMFENKNVELIKKEDSLNNVVLTLEKTSLIHSNKYQKLIKQTKENAAKTKDLTADGIKDYFKDRYQDENVIIADTTGRKVITDLVYGDSALAQNKLLVDVVSNKDSIIVVKDKIILNSGEIRGNLLNANSELKLANEIKDKAIENQSVIIKKEKRKSLFLKVGIAAIGAAFILK
jgi:hypothetical protein